MLTAFIATLKLANITQRYTFIAYNISAKFAIFVTIHTSRYWASITFSKRINTF